MRSSRLDPLKEDPLAGSSSADWAALGDVIDKVERDALAVYRHLGLPTQPGHYVRQKGKPGWRLSHAPMTAADRWNYLLDNPEARPRDIPTLAELGIGGTSLMGRKAGALLRATAELRSLSENQGRGLSPEALNAAVLLGVAWGEVRRLMQDAKAAGRPGKPTR